MSSQSLPAQTAYSPANQRHQPSSTEKITEKLEYAHLLSEMAPAIAQEAAMVTPLVSTGYIGFDVFNTARKTYNRYADLPRKERLEKTAVKTGKSVLFHVLATIAIPLLIIKATHKKVDAWVKRPTMPAWVRRHPRLSAGFIVTGILAASAQLVDKAVGLLLDVTYRPLVEHKPPKRLPTVQQQMNRLLETVTRRDHNQTLQRPTSFRQFETMS